MAKRGSDIHDLLYQTARRGDLWMIKYLYLEAILKHEHGQDYEWLRQFKDKQAIYNRLEAIWEKGKDDVHTGGGEASQGQVGQSAKRT